MEADFGRGFLETSNEILKINLSLSKILFKLSKFQYGQEPLSLDYSGLASYCLEPK